MAGILAFKQERRDPPGCAYSQCPTCHGLRP
ncbi:conserved hypothetical protein, partial [delta proteobacterium NaphS2]